MAAPWERSLSVVITLDAKPCLFSRVRISLTVADRFVRRWTSISSTSPSSSTAHHIYSCFPATWTTISSRCQRELGPPSQAARNLRPELQHPSAVHLAAHLETALESKALELALAQCEPKVQPNSMLDDDGRHLVALVGQAMRQPMLAARSQCGAASVTSPLRQQD